MPNICHIFGAGPFYGLCAAIAETDLILAADGGLAHCLTLGLTPTLALGDFDSFMGEIPPGIPTERHPPEKDDTDMLLALRRGLALGAREFHLYGGTGGRLDHSLANLQCLAFAAKVGVRAYLHGEEESFTAIHEGEMSVFLPKGVRFSLFCLGADVEGLTIEGAKYCLTEGQLTADFPLGISNEALGGEVRISLRRGTVLFCREGQGWAIL